MAKEIQGDLFTLDAGESPIVVSRGAPAQEDVEHKAAKAERVLTRLLECGNPCCVSWSAGKDSSAVLNLLLCAAARMNRSGHAVPPIFVTHADTGIENPEVALYARNEMTAVRTFAREHNLDVTIETSHPTLLNHWAVRVIGGRALPPFPGTNRLRGRPAAGEVEIGPLLARSVSAAEAGLDARGRAARVRGAEASRSRAYEDLDDAGATHAMGARHWRQR